MRCWLLLPPVRDGSDWSSMSRIAIWSGCLVEDTVPFGSSSTIPGNRFLYRLRGRGPLYGYIDIPRIDPVETGAMTDSEDHQSSAAEVWFAWEDWSPLCLSKDNRELDWWCTIRDYGDIRWRIRLMFRVDSEFMDGVIEWPTRYCDALCLILIDRDVLHGIPPF